MKEKILKIQKKKVVEVYEEWGEFLDAKEMASIFNNMSLQKFYRLIKVEQKNKK